MPEYVWSEVAMVARVASARPVASARRRTSMQGTRKFVGGINRQPRAQPTRRQLDALRWPDIMAVAAVEAAASVRCPLATVFGSDDLVGHILTHGGLGACAVFGQCSHSLALSASALVARWAELTPLRTIMPEACDSLLNPSYMLALDDGGLLVSSGCPSGGLVCRLLLFGADAVAAEEAAETAEVPRATVRTLRPNLPRAAQFSSPRGLALDASGEWLYVVDRDTNRILKMDLRHDLRAAAPSCGVGGGGGGGGSGGGSGGGGGGGDGGGDGGGGGAPCSVGCETHSVQVGSERSSPEASSRSTMPSGTPPW